MLCKKVAKNKTAILLFKNKKHKPTQKQNKHCNAQSSLGVTANYNTKN